MKRSVGGLLPGLFIVYFLFEASARSLGSDRGQAGLLVAALVVAAALIIQRLQFEGGLAQAAAALGLGMPSLRGMLAAAILGGVLLLVVSLYLLGTRAAWSTYPGAALLLPGLFAQAGIAEEILFRGYLFGNLRRSRSFWRAALLSMPPFVAVHLWLFVSLPWPLALAASGLALATVVPLARLFELGGGTLWAPALLHFVIQATLKIIVVEDGSRTALPLLWMAACAALPYLVFALPRPGTEGSRFAAR